MDNCKVTRIQAMDEKGNLHVEEIQATHDWVFDDTYFNHETGDISDVYVCTICGAEKAHCWS